MITKQINSLLYIKNEDKWVSFPKWACFFIEVGRIFYDILPSTKKSNIVLTLPTRSFAGVLIAYGASLSAMKSSADDEFVNKHFLEIKSLELGTSVFYRKNNRTYRGLYSGTETIRGEERIKITVQNKKSGNLTEFLNSQQSLSVQVASEKNFKLPNNQIGRENRVSEFLKTGFDKRNYNRLLTYSQTLFYYIGRKNTVKSEVLDTPVAFYNSESKSYIEGCLNEVLRINEFLSDQESFQSHFLTSSSSNDKLKMNSSEPGTFTIFDGSISYLRWKETLEDTHSIIILDRTEPQFENALLELEDEYIISGRTDRDFPINMRTCPNGIEMLYWEV